MDKTQHSVESSEGLKCPYCGFTDRDDLQDYITWWGSDDREQAYCSSCDLKFEVKEVVKRSWESFPIVQEKAV